MRHSMSQSLSVGISQSGTQIKSCEISVNTSDLSDLIEKLRQVQRDTNEFLTELISDNGVSDAADGEEDDDEEDSDENTEEPEVKVPKLQ